MGGIREPAMPGTPIRENAAHLLAYLRTARAAKRRGGRRDTAFALYCAVLFSLLWGVPALHAAARAADGDDGGPPPAADRILDTLPATVPALLACVTLLMVRRATWRGPVLLEAPAVSWLLSQPVPRGPLLRPPFLRAALSATGLGMLGGGGLGFLVDALGGRGPWWALTLAGAWAGGTTALSGTALGVLVQRYLPGPSSERPWRRLFPAAWAVTGALCLPAAWSLVLGRVSPGTWTLLGVPWGWAALPLTTASGAGGGMAGAIAGAALTTAASAALVVTARRVLPSVPARVLREQAATVLLVTASLYTLDLRQARAAVRGSGTGGPSPGRVRLPPPRRRGLVLPWRDATALLRAPGRPLWAAVWASAAVLLAGAGAAPAVLPLLALPAGYLAAAQLVEAARLESDDPRRAAPLPWTAGALALRHALVPTLLLVTWFLAGNAVRAAAGGWYPGLLLLPAGAPAFVAAALVSACRGRVPTHLMIGSETPLGNTGPLAALVWYVRGPLVVLALLFPVLGRVPAGGAAVPAQAGWVMAVGAVALWWAHRVAGRTAAAGR
jgi:hypothetical protein